MTAPNDPGPPSPARMLPPSLRAREKRVDAILDGALRRLGIARRVHEVQLESIFAEVVGEVALGRAEARSLQRGVLTVAVSHPGLSHQLQLDGPRLIERLNERLHGQVVKRLRFTPLEASGQPATRQPKRRS